MYFLFYCHCNVSTFIRVQVPLVSLEALDHKAHKVPLVALDQMDNLASLDPMVALVLPVNLELPEAPALDKLDHQDLRVALDLLVRMDSPDHLANRDRKVTQDLQVPLVALEVAAPQTMNAALEMEAANITVSTHTIATSVRVATATECSTNKSTARVVSLFRYTIDINSILLFISMITHQSDCHCTLHFGT